MNSTLTYVLLSIAALWIIKKMFGTAVVLGLLLLCVIYLLWKKRATIITQIASQNYFIKGDAKKGKKFYEMAYKTGVMNADCKIAYSSFCLREKDFEKGRSLLNEVLDSRHTSAEDKINARHNLAVLIWKEGNLDEALSILETVHKQRPATNTYGTLGVLYLEKVKQSKNYSDALEFMLDAYDYNDYDKTIADNLGELYLLMGEYEKAQEVYNKLLEQKLFTPMPYYNYGLVLKAMGDIEGARENFEKALDCRFTGVITVTKEMVQQQLESLVSEN